MKKCNECCIFKSLDSFPKDVRQTDSRAGKCRECTNKAAMRRYYNNHEQRAKQYATQRERIISRKVKAVEYLGGVCKDCGGSFPPCVFDFHHLDPKEKEYSPSFLKNCTWEKFKKELDKCVLLCSNCHRIRHN